MQKKLLSTLVLSTCLLTSLSAYAARPVDLSRQPAQQLRSWVATPANSLTLAVTGDRLAEISRNIDAKNTTHIRVQQLHQGYPVFGADAVVHVPAAAGASRSLNTIAAAPQPGIKMNGVVYQDLTADLQNAPQQIFSKDQLQQAETTARDLAQKSYGASEMSVKTNKLVVYVDGNNKAHWAFMVNVYLTSVAPFDIPASPTYLLDAQSFKIYKSWNKVKTAGSPEKGGGLGGNAKTGRLNYDDLPSHLPTFDITRSEIAGALGTCYLMNSNVKMFKGRGSKTVINYPCSKRDPSHNNVFWNTLNDSANGGYAPSNDALYSSTIIQNLYKDWLGVPMLKGKDGKAMVLNVYTHYGRNWENAEWDPEKEEVHLGDGADMFYPLASIDIIAHEVSHGFTSQHSNLVYADQSGAMDEAFSDMAAKAAELYSTNKNTWTLGADVVKEKNAALRYMDMPSKDCSRGNQPGDGCSIDSADQYAFLAGKAESYYPDDSTGERQSYIVHLASGVYNRAFYLLSTTPNWDARKAFVLMATANANYWTSNSTYEQGACGVLSAAKDLNYDSKAVIEAFAKVGINTAQC